MPRSAARSTVLSQRRDSSSRVNCALSLVCIDFMPDSNRQSYYERLDSILTATVMQRHAEVVGAGFAGLTAATALAQRGWTVRVHERAQNVRSIGAGIWIWENGLRVINALGALEPLMRGAHPLRIWETREQNERLIERANLGTNGNSLVFSFVRQHLHQTLLTAATRAGVDIQTDSEVVSANSDGELTLTRDGRVKADLIVVADGVHSRVRPTLRIRGRRTKHNLGAIRLIIPRTEKEIRSTEWSKAIEWWSGPRRILYTPCGQGVLYLCMTIRDTDTCAKRTPLQQDVWRLSFPNLEHILDRVRDEGRYDRFETVSLEAWSAGRVAVVGDAAHAMTPGIAQGAGIAMGNALSLAVSVEKGNSIVDSLHEWESRERPLTEHTQRWAARLWPLLGWPPFLARSLVSTRFVYDRISQQRMKPCNYIPTGTDTIEFNPVALLDAGGLDE